MTFLDQALIESAVGAADECQPVGSPSGNGECWRVRQGSHTEAFKLVINGDRDRLGREVEALERVSSPRVVQFLGQGELVANDGIKHPYLRMEFIDGADVREQLASDGTPDERDLRNFLVQCLEGIAALHQVGVIHRDLKPANVMLRGGRWSDPVVIDLGLSRMPDLKSITIYPWAGGTPYYMAPEQWAGERAIPQTDCWAMAMIAAELAAGEHPFADPQPKSVGDYLGRLSGGVVVKDGAGPQGLRDWIAKAGAYEGYLRPRATNAQHLLDDVWRI